LARRTVFLDTSFVIALENRADPHHERAKALDRDLLNVSATLMLHWGILFEIGDGYARLGRRAKGQQLLARFQNEQGYLVHPITEPLLQEAMKLYFGHSDKEWGLTDCVSFALMKQEGVIEALTADDHFLQAGFKALLLEKT